MIACDIDEVLFPYLSEWVQFYNRTHGTTVKVEDFHSYNFSHVLLDHNEEYITDLIYQFHEAPEFLETQPISGAVGAVKQLQEIGDVHFVTSRQLAIARETCDWIYQYFGIEEKKVHIGNHWCKDTDAVTAMRTKYEMCQLINAHVLIDDSVAYAQECAKAGIQALIFDHNGSYGWNKVEGDIELHENVKRVETWSAMIDMIQNMKESVTQKTM